MQRVCFLNLQISTRTNLTRFFIAYRDIACTIYPVVPDCDAFEKQMEFMLANKAHANQNNLDIDPTTPLGVSLSWLSLCFAVFASGAQSTDRPAKERELTSQVYSMFQLFLLMHSPANSVYSLLFVSSSSNVEFHDLSEFGHHCCDTRDWECLSIQHESWCGVHFSRNDFENGLLHGITNEFSKLFGTRTVDSFSDMVGFGMAGFALCGQLRSAYLERFMHTRNPLRQKQSTRKSKLCREYVCHYQIDPRNHSRANSQSQSCYDLEYDKTLCG